MSEVKRWRMSDMPLSEYGLYTEVVLASEYDAAVKDLETARRVREKLTERVTAWVSETHESDEHLRNRLLMAEAKMIDDIENGATAPDGTK